MIGTTEMDLLVAVLFVGYGKEDATTYAKYTASKMYKDRCIDVVNMYRWLFPVDVANDGIAEEYGNEQLSDIMTYIA
jgi:hypothetical protein